ncbi:hypothetical protein IU321_004247 [Escherichia coli]|nr:hypothetical protein [Escherichia coli]EGO6600797.1 hypothetical protein [Escherichia coli]
MMRAVTGKWWLSGGDENKKIPQCSAAAGRDTKINFKELLCHGKKR